MTKTGQSPAPRNSTLPPLMARLPILALLLATATASAQPAKGDGLRFMGMTAQALDATEPTSANPFLAFLTPDTEPDFEYWTTKTAFDGALRARTRTLRGFRSSPQSTYRERERAVFNRNDGPDRAETIPAEQFGRAATEPIVEITGTFEPALSAPTRLAATAEDDPSGRIVPFAVTAERGTETIVSGRLGDGPFANTTGDVDVFDITIPQAAYVEIAVRTGSTSGLNDPVMRLFGPRGEWVLSADDEEDYDPVAGRVFTTPGTYRLFVWGYGTQGLTDWADAGSGNVGGAGGAYELHVSVPSPDIDSYAVELAAGDVLGAVAGEPVVDMVISGPDGSVRMRSQTDITGSYPDDGPLLSPGEAGVTAGGIAAATVAPVAGTYTVSVVGEGAYTLTVQSARPGHERAGGQAVQTIYVEFDGGVYHPGRELADTRDTTSLSPLRAFLPRWGLAASDEDAVIDEILRTLRRTLRDDLRALPGMGRLDLRILNDRDHSDPGPDVNRLVIAGTSEEIGDDGFLGQASTVDVGNFRQDDVAYVVLDEMSDPRAVAGSSSLNQFAVDSTRTKAELVGLGVGTVAAHEAGHFFGLHHTENENAVHNVQDAGGSDLAPRFDIGADRVFGPGDGRGVRFVSDDLYRSHAFEGVQQAPEALALGLYSAAGVSASTETDDFLRAEGFGIAARSAVNAAPRTARLSLDDAFGSDVNGWAWASETSGAEVAVSGGNLRITATNGTTLLAPFENTGGPVGTDFVARFDLRYAAGCEHGGAGAFARRADSAYTGLLMDAEGSIVASTVYRWTGSAWDVIEPWERAPAIAPGEWNTVEVVVLGARATLIVNGQVVRRATVPTGVGESGLVIRSCSGDAPGAMSYDVDNLTVVALDPPGATASGVRSFGGVAAVPSEGAAPAPNSNDE